MLTLAVATAAGAGATLEQENKMLKEQVARQADALKICEANASPAAQPAKKKTLFGAETLPCVDFDCSQCYSPPPPLPPLLPLLLLPILLLIAKPLTMPRVGFEPKTFSM
mgnify:CR=1 FL=1